MKKIILLIIGLLSLQLSAQNIELAILPKSVKVKNDSLYFRYRIQNNSDTIFILYNVRVVDVATEEMPFDNVMNENPNFKFAPRFFIFFYDKNEVFQPKNIIRTRGFNPSEPIIKTYEDSIHSISYGKYIVLNPGKYVEYDIKISFENNIKLNKGTYKFRLGYFSCDKYKQLYLKAKKQDGRLKNSVLFEGEIKSKMCTFEYPYDKRKE